LAIPKPIPKQVNDELNCRTKRSTGFFDCVVAVYATDKILTNSMRQAEEKLQKFFEFTRGISPQKNLQASRFDQDSQKLAWSIGNAVLSGYRLVRKRGLFRLARVRIFQKKDWTKNQPMAIIWGLLIDKRFARSILARSLKRAEYSECQEASASVAGSTRS
jgi:hypothetical protein